MKNFIKVCALFIILHPFGVKIRAQELPITGQGNGGIGVKVEDKFYLFDLYENSLHDDVYFNHDVSIDPMLRERLRKKFPEKFVSNEVIQLLALKLSEISLYSPLTAKVLLRTIEILNWSFSPDKLKVVDRPNDNTDLDLSGVTLINLAIRRNGNITFNSKFWDEKDEVADLDKGNKVALIIHETIHSYSKHLQRTGRLVTAYLFSRSMSPEIFEFDYFKSQVSHVSLVAYPGFNEEYVEYKLKKRLGSWFAKKSQINFLLMLNKADTSQTEIYNKEITLGQSEEQAKELIKEYCGIVVNSRWDTNLTYGVWGGQGTVAILGGGEYRDVQTGHYSAHPELGKSFQHYQYISISRSFRGCTEELEEKAIIFLREFKHLQ